MDRLKKFNFRDAQGLKLENNDKFHDLVNDANYYMAQYNKTKVILQPGTAIDDSIISMIHKDSKCRIDERIIMSIINNLGLVGYRDRLQAIDCIKKGMICSNAIMLKEY